MSDKYRYLTVEERKAVENLIRSIKKQLEDRIKLIKIFGSKIRGDFRADSDIDILIVL